MATQRPPAKPKAPRKPAARKASTAPAKASAAKPATKPAPPKAAAPKTATPKAATKAPARKSAVAKPAAKRSRKGLISAIALGIIATGSAIALFGRRLLGPGNAEHEAPDLALDQPYPGPEDRAPVMFRPDPTAEVPASEREGLRPASAAPELMH